MSVGLAYNQRAYTIRNDKQREAKHGHLVGGTQGFLDRSHAG
jgi:hypothetical protein